MTIILHTCLLCLSLRQMEQDIQQVVRELTFAAVLAAVGFLARVQHFVFFEVGLGGVGVATHGAHVGFDALV